MSSTDLSEALHISLLNCLFLTCRNTSCDRDANTLSCLFSCFLPIFHFYLFFITYSLSETFPYLVFFPFLHGSRFSLIRQTFPSHTHTHTHTHVSQTSWFSNISVLDQVHRKNVSVPNQNFGCQFSM